MNKIKVNTKTKSLGSTQGLKVNQFAKVKYNGESILLRTYDGFVSLTNPKDTWGDSCNFEVLEVYKPGDTITITIGESNV